jgi:hypothetical protein
MGLIYKEKCHSHVGKSAYQHSLVCHIAGQPAQIGHDDV